MPNYNTLSTSSSESLPQSLISSFSQSFLLDKSPLIQMCLILYQSSLINLPLEILVYVWFFFSRHSKTIKNVANNNNNNNTRTKLIALLLLDNGMLHKLD